MEAQYFLYPVTKGLLGRWELLMTLSKYSYSRGVSTETQYSGGRHGTEHMDCLSPSCSQLSHGALHEKTKADIQEGSFPQTTKLGQSYV